MYVNIRNQTSLPIAIRAGTVIGKATPATFVFRQFVETEKTETEFVNRVIEKEFVSETSSEYSSLVHN